jgi:antitoxin component YwqK of YwqJK toxin-antitoxin module
VIAAVVGLGLVVAALPPLACPPRAERRGAAPPEGFEEWCEGKDDAGRGRREGPARVYYDDGAPWVEETFREGLRDGPFKEWHRNGRTAREGAFSAGRKVGPWRVSYESGAPEEHSEWRDGVPHGPFVSFFAAGGKRTEGRYCGGAQCGTWRTWDEAGRLVGAMEHGEQTLAP